MAMGSPDRAWARASVQLHISPYMAIVRGVMISTTAEPFPSRSWRT